MVEAAALAAVRSDMGEHMATAKAADDRPDDFYPGLTRRTVALMHRSPRCWPTARQERSIRVR